MTKEMIISSNGHETMVAILEDDLVAEIFVERERHRGVVGNVYKGRVSKVLPGMQSSFIDLGLERDGSSMSRKSSIRSRSSSGSRAATRTRTRTAPNLERRSQKAERRKSRRSSRASRTC